MALPPGPKDPALIALMRWMADPTGNFERCFRAWGDLYSIKNPILGREVVVADPALIKQIFTGDTEVFHGGEPNLSLSPIVGARSVIVIDGKPHHRKRKLLLPPFHGERLAVYGDVMREITEREIKKWPVGRPVSALPAMQRITFDVILQTVFGVREGEALDVLRQSLLSLVEKAQSPLGMLWLMPAFQRDLGPLTGWASIKRSLKETDEILYGVIAKARAAGAGGDKRTDVLSLLLSAVDEQGEPMTDGELRDELMTLLLAGYETTSLALAWAIEDIVRRPEVLGRILDEIAAAGRADAPLPYLDATIKEVLRLRPIIPLLGRRLAQPVTLREFEIPTGTYVLPCVYLANRHPGHWERADEFVPERFLDKKPDPYLWIPFGGGARRCIGMAFALFEMRVVLSSLLPALTLRLPDKPAKVSLRSLFFSPSKGTRVVVEEARAA